MANDLIRIAQTRVELDDPHLTIDYRDRLGIRFALYDALVKRQPDGSFAPALAEWSVLDDARTWLIRPREQVRFHNGAVLTVDDILASLARVLNPARTGELGTGGVIQGYLQGVRCDVVLDDTIHLRFDQPIADLLDILVDLPIIPSSIATNDVVAPIGTGPFRIDHSEDGLIRAVRWDGYWGNLPTTEAVEWRRVPDAADRLDLLLAGEVELASDLPEISRERFERAEGYRFVDMPSTMAVAFICNAAEGVCTDPRVRQALNYAVDVDELIGATGRIGAAPLNGPLTRNSLGHDPALPPYPYDPARARELLASAGYGAGLRLTLDVPERLPDEAPLLAHLLREQLARIGIETIVRSFADRPGYAEMVRAKQIDDACCFDSTPISTYRVLREKLHGRVRGPWWQGYQNPAVDDLLDQAAATPDDRARQALYRRAYRLIHDDAPWLFLYSPRLSWGAATGVTWTPSPTGLIQIQ